MRADLVDAVDLFEHFLRLRDEAVVFQRHDEPVTQCVCLDAVKKRGVVLRVDEFIERLLAGDELRLVNV